MAATSLTHHPLSLVPCRLSLVPCRLSPLQDGGLHVNPQHEARHERELQCRAARVSPARHTAQPEGHSLNQPACTCGTHIVSCC